MRVQIMSDLHQEFAAAQFSLTDADLVILAGDIHTKRNALPWIRWQFPDVPVLYVVGNHEFYGEKFPGNIHKLKQECAGSDIHVLENEAFELGGYRFFGCTLWTDLRLFGCPQAGALEALQMNDYKRVRQSSTYRRLRPAITAGHHHASCEKIRDFLDSGDPARSIVISHHAPSAKSLPLHLQDDRLSCAYASHLDELIISHQPLLWVHGHIHHSSDYRIGQTRVVANPQGYPDHANPDFSPDLAFDLDILRKNRLTAEIAH